MAAPFDCYDPATAATAMSQDFAAFGKFSSHHPASAGYEEAQSTSGLTCHDPPQQQVLNIAASWPDDTCINDDQALHLLRQ